MDSLALCSCSESIVCPLCRPSLLFWYLFQCGLGASQISAPASPSHLRVSISSATCSLIQPEQPPVASLSVILPAILASVKPLCSSIPVLINLVIRTLFPFLPPQPVLLRGNKTDLSSSFLPVGPVLISCKASQYELAMNGPSGSNVPGPIEPREPTWPKRLTCPYL